MLGRNLSVGRFVLADDGRPLVAAASRARFAREAVCGFSALELMVQPFALRKLVGIDILAEAVARKAQPARPLVDLGHRQEAIDDA